MKKAHPVDIHVGRRLRIMRLERNLSQEKLAAQAGVSFQQLQKYERGVNRISASRLYELACILDVCLYDFFEGLDPPGVPPDPDFRQAVKVLLCFLSGHSREIRTNFESIERQANENVKNTLP